MFYFDPSRKDFKNELFALSPEPVYCVFADIVKSTDLKQQHPFPTWAALIYNTFVSLRSYLPASFQQPLKSLGDGLLYVFPEQAWAVAGESVVPAYLKTAEKQNFLDELGRKRIEVVLWEVAD